MDCQDFEEERDSQKLKKIFNEYLLSPEKKFKIFSKYVNIEEFKEDCLEILWNLRDSIPYIKGYNLDDAISFLEYVSNSSMIIPHERIISATCLYNHGYISKCYNCFKCIAIDDKNVDYVNRVESAKFLFSSDDEDYRECAQNVIIDIIDSEELECESRYKIITEFMTKSGIRSFLNKFKLRIPYSEEFVYGLQTIFFYNPKNNIREKILSGQHLLQMSFLSENEKLEIENYFLDIAENPSYEENERADAADVVLRISPSSDQKLKAREIIGRIGSEKKSGNTLSEKTDNLYSNSQNVHYFADQITDIVENLIKENIELAHVKYENVHSRVVDYVNSHVTDREKRFKILKSLNRISIDTATFTKFNSTLSEIFVLIWVKVEKNKNKDQLKIRLLEELIDMGETCSTGHIARFVNVFSHLDETVNIKVSWSQQIISNFIGRMDAKIRDHPDEDIKYSLIVALTDLSSDKDKEIYNKFIQEQTTILEKELYEEFVTAKYTTKEEFYEAFSSAVSKIQMV